MKVPYTIKWMKEKHFIVDTYTLQNILNEFTQLSMRGTYLQYAA